MGADWSMGIGPGGHEKVLAAHTPIGIAYEAVAKSPRPGEERLKHDGLCAQEDAMTKTENTTTGMRAVLGGVFGASCIAPQAGTFLAATPGYLPTR
jgi:hypothetical protein